MIEEQSTYRQLRNIFETFYYLNPGIVEPERDKIASLATETNPQKFSEFADIVSDLISRFLTSPWKQTEQQSVQGYLDVLNNAQKRLQARNEIDGPDSDTDSPCSVALAQPAVTSPKDWYKIKQEAGQDTPLHFAMDAAVTRNEEAGSIFETAFIALHCLSPEAAEAWQLEFLRANRGNLDPDIIRDLLRAWKYRQVSNPKIAEWVLEWNADKRLTRQWSQIQRESDAFLRHRALREWLNESGQTQRVLQHLDYIVRNYPHDPERISRWLYNAISNLAERMGAFIMLSRQVPSESGEDREVFQEALMRELTSLEEIVKPVLVVADFMLKDPDGARRFALALLGISASLQERWRKQLKEKSIQKIRGLLLQDLKEERTPVRTIRKFCLGDEELFLKLRGYLDLMTMQFESLESREIVLDYLAANWTSYCFPDLMARQITKRYRGLMHLLHIDNLQRLLTPAQLEQFKNMETLPELTSLAGDARRYLETRRALDLSIDEIMSTALQFEETIRERRLQLLRRILM